MTPFATAAVGSAIACALAVMVNVALGRRHLALGVATSLAAIGAFATGVMFALMALLGPEHGGWAFVAILAALAAGALTADERARRAAREACAAPNGTTNTHDEERS